MISSTVFNSCKKESNPVTPSIQPIPELSSPAKNSTAVFMPITFSWNPLTGATGYWLQVSTDSSFTSFGFNKDSIITTNYQVTALNPLTQYFWRVSATTENGQSNWSTPVWTFITASGGNTGIPCPGLPTITYFGKIYHTVQINNQCWLKENLDVGEMISGNGIQTNNNFIEKYCYNNDLKNCMIYGGLYQWSETMQYKTSGGNVQGICPTGWHIPSSSEIDSLSKAVNGNGNALKALWQGTGSGAGTDTSGFSALLSGYSGHFGAFYDKGLYTNFWCSNESDTANAGVMWLGSIEKSVNKSYSDKYVGFSVRCIKD